MLEPVAAETLQVSGSGPVTASFVPTSVGTWRVTSEYSGDANNTSATTACDATVFAAQKATPMPSVTAVPGLAEDGDRIHARVDLGSAYRPTGRVAFSLSQPNDSSCSGAPTYVEEVVLTGTGAATSGGFEVPKHARRNVELDGVLCRRREQRTSCVDVRAGAAWRS